MILCPNTSPLLVLGRMDRLDLLGDPARTAGLYLDDKTLRQTLAHVGETWTPDSPAT